MIDASVDISFDKLDQPAAVRRRSMTRDSFDGAPADREVRYADIPEFLRKHATTQERRFPVAVERFLVAAERAGPNRLPVTLDELVHAGLPGALVDDLRVLVTQGHPEADVVRAFYEALASLVAVGVVNAPVSRQLLRALRRQFVRADECRDLRDSVLKLVRDATAQPREAGLGV
jgi:uncharacterized protein (DUF488 family)